MCSHSALSDTTMKAVTVNPDSNLLTDICARFTERDLMRPLSGWRRDARSRQLQQWTFSKQENRIRRHERALPAEKTRGPSKICFVLGNPAILSISLRK